MNDFYYYVWGLYAASAVGLLYLSWLIFRHIKVPVLRLVSILLVAAMLFTPAKMISEQQDLTPALMIALFGGLAEGWPGVWHGAKYILLVYVCVLALLVFAYSIRSLSKPKESRH
jgi:hypothetical protein